MPKTIRPFLDFYHDLNYGTSAEDASRKLNELISAVEDTGKVGTLTLVIKVAPADNAEGMVKITDEVKVKIPEPARPASFWFVTPDGNVTRDSPNQPRLPLQEVAPLAAPIDINSKEQAQ